MWRTLLPATLAPGLGVAGQAVLARTAEPARTADAAEGKTFVDAKGMTLYVFDRDAAGTSHGSGACATNWPPPKAAAADKPVGSWTIVMRDDGSRPWAYKAKPLHSWVKDTKAGDVAGDGVNGLWHVAQP